MKKKGGEFLKEYDQLQDNPSQIVLEGALDNITINEFIYFLTLINTKACKIVISDSTVEMMIENGKQRGQIKGKDMQDLKKSVTDRKKESKKKTSKVK